MEFKGTREKWEIIYQNEIGALVGIGKFKDSIAMVWGQNGTYEEEHKANALLISKAPKMLTFLSYLVSNYENGLIEDIEDIILKAEKIIKEATEL